MCVKIIPSSTAGSPVPISSTWLQLVPPLGKSLIHFELVQKLDFWLPHCFCAGLTYLPCCSTGFRGSSALEVTCCRRFVTSLFGVLESLPGYWASLDRRQFLPCSRQGEIPLGYCRISVDLRCSILLSAATRFESFTGKLLRLLSSMSFHSGVNRFLLSQYLLRFLEPLVSGTFKIM